MSQPVLDPASPTAAPESLGPGGIPYERFLDCVHCGLCTSACPTYLETGNENDSPRGRIYLMRAVTDGRIGLTPQVERHLELCLDCRSCETACPSGVQYGRLIEPFRAAMQAGELGATPGAVRRAEVGPRPTPHTGWFERFVLYGLFPYPDKMRRALAPARWAQRLGLDRLANAIGLTRLLPEKLRRMQRLLPPLDAPLPPLPERLPPLNADGSPTTAPPRARVMLFRGCVADAMFRRTNWATARVLQVNGCEVLVPASQACCGAIHYHSGAAGPAMDLARQNAAAADSRIDAVIVNVAGCGSMLKDYGHIAQELGVGIAQLDSLTKFAAKVRDVSEFLIQLGPVQPTHSIPLTVTYHDACHLCHAQRIREQPRRLLELIPGLKLVPLAESEICCGAAGSYNLTEAEMADRLGQRKARHIAATNAAAVVTANAGCSLQIQALLRESGAPLPVYHPLDLLVRSYLGDDWARSIP
jgi:glycolate oxidase iron-sulfur subunit